MPRGLEGWVEDARPAIAVGIGAICWSFGDGAGLILSIISLLHYVPLVLPRCTGKDM